MKSTTLIIKTILVIILCTASMPAQTEQDLRNYFEGKKVEVRIDMPASRGGVNIYPERRKALDISHYRDLSRKYGSSLLEGDRIMITKIKVKKRHIEFQLGGGGYGGWRDETSPSVFVNSASKSERERNLEKDLKKTVDERKRREIKEEISDLKKRREREDARNEAIAATAEEIAKQRIDEKRLRAGSRFNIRFNRRVADTDLTNEKIKEALKDYVYFID